MTKEALEHIENKINVWESGLQKSKGIFINKKVTNVVKKQLLEDVEEIRQNAKAGKLNYNEALDEFYRWQNNVIDCGLV